MKRFLAILLALVMVFSLVACGEKKNEDEKKDDKQTEQEGEKKDEAKDEQKDAKTITPMELMKNLHARRAIAMGFDKEYIVDVILANGSFPVDFLVPKGLCFDDAGKDFREMYPDGFLHYNPEEAKKEWALAKEELGFNEIEIEFLTYDSESSKKISEFIQGQLSTNLEGMKLVLNQQPFKQKLDLAKKGQFQLEFAGWGPDYPDPMTFLDLFITGSGHNTAGYSNPDYDKTILDCKTGELTADAAKRWTTLQEAEKTLLEDAAVIPLYQRGLMYLMKPHLKGIENHAFGPDFTYKNATTDVKTDGLSIIRLAATSDIPSMDTNKSTDQVSFEVMGNVMEGLVMLDEHDQVKAGVAESWDVSADGLTYTFKLRDSKWSNGDAITAQDFVDSWRRLTDPATGSQYAFMTESAGILNATAVMNGEMTPDKLGVEAIDEKTLKVTLAQPTPFFLKLMTFPSFYPINKAFVDSLGDEFGTAPDKVLYNGAYVLTQWDIGYGFGFRKNEAYWDAANTKNDGVDYRIVKEVSAAVSMYDNGEIDRCALSGEFVEQRQDSPDVLRIPDTAVFYLNLNINNTEGSVKGQ